MRTIGNDKIIIVEVQDDRFFIQSNELAYGRWIYNSELKKLIENKSPLQTDSKTDSKKIYNCSPNAVKDKGGK